MILGIVSSCRDDDKFIYTLPINNSNNTYTLKAKIVNGTTGNALYTKSKMYLKMERHAGLGFIDEEQIGSGFMESDGSIEISYKHNALGDYTNTRAVLFSNAFPVGFGLPPNQDVDTVIYESTMGRVVIHTIDNEPFNRKLYWAYYRQQDSLVSDSSDINESRFINIRIPNLGFGMYYDFEPLEIRDGILRGQPNSKVINMRGDPYIDTLTIEY